MPETKTYDLMNEAIGESTSYRDEALQSIRFLCRQIDMLKDKVDMLTKAHYSKQEGE